MSEDFKFLEIPENYTSQESFDDLDYTHNVSSSGPDCLKFHMRLTIGKIADFSLKNLLDYLGKQKSLNYIVAYEDKDKRGKNVLPHLHISLNYTDPINIKTVHSRKDTYKRKNNIKGNEQISFQRATNPVNIEMYVCKQKKILASNVHPEYLKYYTDKSYTHEELKKSTPLEKYIEYIQELYEDYQPWIEKIDEHKYLINSTEGYQELFQETVKYLKEKKLTITKRKLKNYVETFLFRTCECYREHKIEKLCQEM